MMQALCAYTSSHSCMYMHTNHSHTPYALEDSMFALSALPMPMPVRISFDTPDLL